ncbi:MAG: hypothetical protein WD467_01045 [Candidatus Saccharimonadales bacterium]
MIYILYRPSSEHSRAVEEFTRELEKRRIEHDLVDVDSRDGAAKVQSYGITAYPAVLAVKTSDGQALQTWSATLPTVSEVEYYAWSSV